MAEIIKKINQNIHLLLLAVSSIIYFIYFSIASILRYDNYYTGRFDLGNMAQTVWNTFHGNFFMLTDPNGTREVSRLAFHADFILILLAPFYLIWEDPRMLLIIQSGVLALGGIFVYLLAKDVLKNKTISLILAFCYFLNPAVNYTNLYDFHAVTFATTFLLAAFYFIQKKNYVLVAVFLLLAGLTKEQVWFINSLIGGYIFFFKKERAIGLTTAIISGIIFYILIWIAIPNALGDQHFALEYYSDFGDSPDAIIKNILLNPVQTIQTLLLKDRVDYFRQLFFPLGYVSLLSPFYLVFAGPDMLINFLSKNPTLHQIYYQYSATVTPFIFISTISAIAFIRKRLPEIPLHFFTVFILITSLISARTYGPLPISEKANLAMFKEPLEIRSSVDKYIAEIPTEDSVSASNNIASHLSHRRNIYVVPQGINNSDWVIFHRPEKGNIEEKRSFEDIKENEDFKLIFTEQNFYVFKRANR
jgi:uncharacterized membrane protein